MEIWWNETVKSFYSLCGAQTHYEEKSSSSGVGNKQAY